MAKREKMPEFKRKGNWKNAPGSQAATKKSRGVATTEAVKKMKQKESMVPKPRDKPVMSKTTARKAPDKGTTPNLGSVRIDARSSQATSVKKASDAKKSKSPSSLKPLKTGARSSRTSNTVSPKSSALRPVKGEVKPQNRSGSRSITVREPSKKPQSRSGSTGPKPKKNWGMTRAMSENSVTRMRKPLKTGARSSRTSGTGYKEGSFMDRMTRAVRRNIYGKK